MEYITLPCLQLAHFLSCVQGIGNRDVHFAGGSSCVETPLPRSTAATLYGAYMQTHSIPLLHGPQDQALDSTHYREQGSAVKFGSKAGSETPLKVEGVRN